MKRKILFYGSLSRAEKLQLALKDLEVEWISTSTAPECVEHISPDVAMIVVQTDESSFAPNRTQWIKKLVDAGCKVPIIASSYMKWRVFEDCGCTRVLRRMEPSALIAAIRDVLSVAA